MFCFPAALQTGEAGVAVEYMVALANEMNASAWFCLPKTAAAEDDYIRQLATLVHTNLR